jgi:hypothetical protein
MKTIYFTFAFFFCIATAYGAFSVDSVTVDSVWNSDSSWYDNNGLLQQRNSRDCRISFLPRDSGTVAQCSVSVSLDSGKTWNPTPNPLRIIVDCINSVIHHGQKGVVIVRVFGQDRANVVFRIKIRLCPITPGCPHSPQPPPVDAFDPAIRIISPNGGEVFQVGQQCTVKVCSRYRPAGGAEMRIVIGGKAYTTPQYYPGPMKVNSMEGDSSEFAHHGDSVVIANIFAIPDTLYQLSGTAKISSISDECVIVIGSYNPPYYPDTSDCYFSIKKSLPGMVYDWSDTLALRAILDANGLTSISASSPGIVVLTLVNGNIHRIRELNLTNKGITVIPASIKNLTALQILRLDSNSITALPPEIASCTSLVRIQMSNNQLATIPAELSSLRHLTTLILSHNGITTLPLSLWTITSLNVLQLNYNNLTELAAEVSNLVNLSSLSLNNNSLTTLPQSLTALTSLQMLEINNNHICPNTLPTTFVGWLDNRAEPGWETTQGTCP